MTCVTHSSGKTLRKGLEVLGKNAAELARRIKVPVNRITEILNGRRSVTGDTVLRLGHFFGTSGVGIRRTCACVDGKQVVFFQGFSRSCSVRE